MATNITGLDDALTLDAIYYSAQIPRNLSVLTVMGTVFDRVYFPGVYIPTKNFDQRELEREIERLKTLPPSQLGSTQNLIGMLSVIEHAKTLEGFCVFTGDGNSPFAFSESISGIEVHKVYEAIHGESPPNWQPIIETWHHKAMPGSQEHITYPSEYYYFVGAMIESAKTGIPLLNDVPGLPIPGIKPTVQKDDAKALATILTIECTKLVLPTLPVLHPNDLMEFRDKNKGALRTFRRSMLGYAKDLNDKIDGLDVHDFERKTKFFIQTEIVPVLDELRAAADNSGPWFKRAMNAFCVAPEVGAEYYALGAKAALIKAFVKYAPELFKEFKKSRDTAAKIKHSELYYLLQLHTFYSNR
jgi:hypothetical protein